MQFEKIFPKVIGIIKETDDSLFEKELHYLTELNYIDYGNNMGISENTYILNDPKLSRCKEYIIKNLEDYKNEMGWDCKFFITQSWVIVDNKGVSTYQHTHPNSFLSGVLYLQNLDSVPLEFHPSDYPTIQPTIKYYNINNSLKWDVSLKNGLVIFPSNLRHSAPPNTSDIPKVAISFNVFINSKIGDEYQLKGLDLSKL